jgi:hypothetical protein
VAQLLGESAVQSLDWATMKTRPGICQRKHRYATRAEAEAAAVRADITLRAYKCALCRNFHLTSRTKGLRVPRPITD